jgi:hypothetical protein
MLKPMGRISASVIRHFQRRETAGYAFRLIRQDLQALKDQSVSQDQS